MGASTHPPHAADSLLATTFPSARHRYSFRDYIRLEEMANTRHEYFDGEIYAMAGGSPAHALAAANVIATLNAQLRARHGDVFTSVSHGPDVALPSIGCVIALEDVYRGVLG